MSNNSDRPLITFALIAYKQERFIREAVEGAFHQTYAPLEIIISDDHSPDKTYEIIQEMAARYRGIHKVRLNQNTPNLGLCGHINRIMELAAGELIVVAAGDDISLPERCGKICDAWLSSQKKARSIFSSNIVIDENGAQIGSRNRDPFHEDDYLPESIIQSHFAVYGNTHAWSRDVFDRFGPMTLPLTCEDMVIPFRSALIGQIAYINEPLVMYRRHGRNVWKNMSDLGDRRAYFEWRQFLLTDRRNIYINWLADLSKFNEFEPDKRKHIEQLNKMVTRNLKSVDNELLLIKSTYLQRISYIMKSVVNKTSFREILRSIGIALLPSIYFRYLKSKEVRHNSRL